VKVGRRWTYLYRALDQHGQVIDVLVSTRRDDAAARRFFARAVGLDVPDAVRVTLPLDRLVERLGTAVD
jgi:transposase-like protein